VTKDTLIELMKKWEYRMLTAASSGGVSISEPEAEELLYLLRFCFRLQAHAGT
jgi:hypothetical protein